MAASGTETMLKTSFGHHPAALVAHLFSNKQAVFLRIHNAVLHTSRYCCKPFDFGCQQPNVGQYHCNNCQKYLHLLQLERNFLEWSCLSLGILSLRPHPMPWKPSRVVLWNWLVEIQPGLRTKTMLDLCHILNMPHGFLNSCTPSGPQGHKENSKPTCTSKICTNFGWERNKWNSAVLPRAARNL